MHHGEHQIQVWIQRTVRAEREWNPSIDQRSRRRVLERLSVADFENIGERKVARILNHDHAEFAREELSREAGRRHARFVRGAASIRSAGR
jgi:hypothetical protein